MAPRTERLGVWLHGVHIADLEQLRWPEIRCRYSEVALESWPLNSPLISCSLPLGERPQDALAFCIGLLPEGQALQALAARALLPVNDTFGLLRRYGRDVAGALVISEEVPEEGRFAVEPYTPEGLAAAIDELEDHPLGTHDDSELSLAGLQDKLLLVDLGGGTWGRPLRGRPSTHILKLDDRRHPGLVEAEAMCLTLAKAVNLTSVESRLETIGGIPCLIVSRFDRRERDGAIERIHQEDLCQALGIDHEARRGRAKYERYGGPTLRQAASLLDVYSVAPAEQLDRLVSAITFSVLIGNADAHGKNLGLLHPTPETVALAPLYDTVPTVLWATLRTDGAMSIGGQTSLPEVTIDDIAREAASWPHPSARARETAATTTEAMTAAIEDGVIPARSGLAKQVLARSQAPGFKP